MLDSNTTHNVSNVLWWLLELKSQLERPRLSRTFLRDSSFVLAVELASGCQQGSVKNLFNLFEKHPIRRSELTLEPLKLFELLRSLYYIFVATRPLCDIQHLAKTLCVTALGCDLSYQLMDPALKLSNLKGTAIVANHIGLVDSVALKHLIPNLYIVMRSPRKDLVNLNHFATEKLKRINVVLFDGFDKGVHEIIADLLAAGKNVLIYPESYISAGIFLGKFCTLPFTHAAPYLCVGIRVHGDARFHLAEKNFNHHIARLVCTRNKNRKISLCISSVRPPPTMLGKAMRQEKSGNMYAKEWETVREYRERCQHTIARLTGLPIRNDLCVRTRHSIVDLSRGKSEKI